jgi:glycylpeptide N-tetradecanoyltransferase
MNSHKFWNTQPVNSNTNNNHEIIKVDLNQVPLKPYSLPEGFEWINFDLSEDLLYQFINKFYKDDVDTKRYFNYSKEFIKWYLSTPSYNYNDLFIGIKANDKIVASICGVPIKINIFDKEVIAVEINFLCVHHSLRNKRLSPVLIKEITRRANLHNIYQAFYTGGMDLPNKIINGSYYHRPLNIPKLVEMNYIDPPNNISMKTYCKLYKTLDSLNLNIRLLEEKDCIEACKKLNEYNQKFKINIIFNQEEFNYKFLVNEKQNIIYSYVVTNEEGNITDFISLYYLPSQIKNEIKYTDVKKAYLYYYFSNDLLNLVDNALYLMKNKDIDIVNCVDQYNNRSFVEKLKFIKGPVDLYFYFYNWTCPAIENKDMSLVMC